MTPPSLVFLGQIRNMNTVWLQEKESRNLEFGAGVKDDRGTLGNCSIVEVNTMSASSLLGFIIL